MTETLWVVGIGVLAFLPIQYYLLKEHYGKKKKAKIEDTLDKEWQEYLEHLKKFTPIPREVPSHSVLQKCEFCNKEFKRVSQHIRMSHKAHDTVG